MNQSETQKMTLKQAFSVVKDLYVKANLAPEVVDVAKGFHPNNIPEEERIEVCQSWMNSLFRPLWLLGSIQLETSETIEARNVLWQYAEKINVPEACFNGIGITGIYPDEMLRGFYEYAMQELVKKIKEEKGQLSEKTQRWIFYEIKNIKEKLSCIGLEYFIECFCGKEVQKRFLDGMREVKSLQHDPLQQVKLAAQIYKDMSDALLKANENLAESIEPVKEFDSERSYRQKYINDAGIDALEELVREIDHYGLRMLKKLERALKTP